MAVMIADHMFHNRQPQAGAAGAGSAVFIPRMALIHPEKAFKHSALVFLGNPDAAVFHCEHCGVFILFPR